MNSKNRVSVPKGEAKGASRQRPPKEDKREDKREDRRKTAAGDAAKKASVGRRADESHPKRVQSANGPSVQQKVQLATTTTSWVKGGSSLSFADVVRRKAENVVMNAQPEELHEDIVEAVHVEDDAVDLMHDIQEDSINAHHMNNESEDIAYATMQQDAAIIQAVIPPPPEEEVMEVPSIKYYVLEIDRIVEESVNLPPRTMATAAEYMGVYTFSGQAGKPPTPPTATQIQQQFYRPETTAARPFGGMGGTSDVSRGQHWGSQPGHTVDYTNANWSLQERGQRVFHQGMQYSSYAPPPPVQQQPQRNFMSQTVNRMLQGDSSDAPLRHLRDSGAFGRHPGNGGGVW